ncbi:unnamed protein product, partial [Mesorhabditis belari]|uniref:Cation efflux protein cytoplasmic domain-containing protein n=1 Tax=Mesorhabditis belari TaxID=2138241 RepID=A0AAF3EHE0_9BILA
MDPENMKETTPLLPRVESIRRNSRPEKPKNKKLCKRLCGCCKHKRIAEFYRHQDQLIDAYKSDDAEMEASDGEDAEKKESTHGDAILSRTVLFINVILLLAKVAATYLTGGASLSIISTLLESVVDITGGAILWYASHSIVRTDYRAYPRGRSKLENLSIILIGVIMGMANFYIIFTSIESILASKEAPSLDYITIGLMIGTIITKFILWIVCYKRGTTSSRVLAIDQRNDSMTVTVAIVGALSARWWSYADPLAASLISAYVAYSWIQVVLEQFPQMSGRAGTPEEYSRIARVCIEHSSHIRGLDTLLVYHTGEKLLVEVHVVVDANLTCKVVHDEVVSPLQRKLQKLSIVERAFVHADHEFDGYV